MKNQVLSIEQMQELIDMGIDTSKASLYWAINKSNPSGRKQDLMKPFLSFYTSNQVVGLERFEYIPTFTLQDILSYFDIYSIENFSNDITLEVKFKGRWVQDINGDNILNIAFEMLKWCKQNNEL